MTTSKLNKLRDRICDCLKIVRKSVEHVPVFQRIGLESKQFEYIVAIASNGKFSRGNSCLLDVESKEFGSLEVKSQNRTAKNPMTHLRTTLCRDYELGEFVQKRGANIYGREVFRKMITRLNKKSAGTLVTIVQYKGMKYDVHVTPFPKFPTLYREWKNTHVGQVWTFRHKSGIELVFNLRGFKVEGKIPLSEPQRVSV
jgi:hypothetical protein